MTSVKKGMQQQVQNHENISSQTGEISNMVSDWLRVTVHQITVVLVYSVFD